jgi:hypothetical protein
VEASNTPTIRRLTPSCRHQLPRIARKSRELSSFRNKENQATVTSFDMFCTGKDTGELVTPDDQTQAIFLRVDRNGDGNADVIFFDLKRRGEWNLSFWDENFSGQWTLVGYHDDGSLKPTSFESYVEFQAGCKSLRSRSPECFQVFR